MNEDKINIAKQRGKMLYNRWMKNKASIFNKKLYLMDSELM